MVGLPPTAIEALEALRQVAVNKKGWAVQARSFPVGTRESSARLPKANMTIHHAKQRGRTQFFSAGMNEAATRATEIDNSLRRGQEAQRLVFYHQPPVRADSGATVGAEALLRMWGPDACLLTPAI